MTKEIEAILRSILFNALVTDDIVQVRRSIMAMCSGDDIAAVKGQLAELDTDPKTKIQKAEK